MIRRMTRQNGFTIIELMIATVVFSLVLTASTAAIVQLGRQYYRGVIQAQLQDNNRAILDEIAQTVQFSSAEVAGDSEASSDPVDIRIFCVGAKRYVLDMQQQKWDADDASVNRKAAVFTVDNGVEECDRSTFTSRQAVTRELVDRGSRITKFSITPLADGSLYKIEVFMAHGDDDLLRSDDADPDRIICKEQGIAVELCAISELSTIVQRRVIN